MRAPARRKIVKLSLIMPARNEAAALGPLLAEIRRLLPDAEVIVVDDGSTDGTATVAAGCGARVISHLYPKGNGAAVKTGARAATGDILVFMDADGQHRPEDIPRLLAKLEEGYDMVVGAPCRIMPADTGDSPMLSSTGWPAGWSTIV